MAHDLVLTETFVEAFESFETEDAKRIFRKLESIVDSPDHYINLLNKYPEYKLRSVETPAARYRAIHLTPVGGDAATAPANLVPTDGRNHTLTGEKTHDL